MSLTTSGPEIPLSSPKCVTTSSSKTLSNNNKNIVVDDHIDNDYRNDITMKTSEAEKQGEKWAFLQRILLKLNLCSMFIFSFEALFDNKLYFDNRISQSDSRIS